MPRQRPPRRRRASAARSPVAARGQAPARWPTGSPSPLAAGPPALPPAGRFLYEKVAGELRRRILRGVYGLGRRIPSEADLVREFQVSAITVRRTVRDLQFEGLLVGRQGVGVFVSDKRRIRRSLSADATTPLRDEMRRAGVEPGVKVVALSLVRADDDVRQRLDLAPGQVPLVYRLETLILGDGEPVGLDTTYFRRELGDALQSELSQEFIYPLLVSRGVAVDHMDFAIEGDAVVQEQAPLLGLPVGFPLLVVHYTGVSPEGAPLFTGRTTTRADRFTYEFCRHPELHRQPGPATAPTRRPDDRAPGEAAGRVHRARAPRLPARAPRPATTGAS